MPSHTYADSPEIGEHQGRSIEPAWPPALALSEDNFFVHHVGAVTMYGVCDGHGPFGHLVSFRLVQTIPYFLTNSEHFGKNWEEALKEAFAKAQEDLEEFCASLGRS